MKSLLLPALLLVSCGAMADDASAVLQSSAGWTQLLLFLGFVAIALGIVSSAHAMAISLGAYAACDKGDRAQAFALAIMPGTQGIYSFAICFLMIEYLAEMPLRAAFAGVICGLSCFFSALGQAKTGASCIKALSYGQMEKGQAYLAMGVQELYALLGLSAAFLAIMR